MIKSSIFLLLIGTLTVVVFGFGNKQKWTRRSHEMFATNQDLIKAALGSVGVFGASLPISIIVDKALQQGSRRISKISNTKIVDNDGEVFAYIKRPIVAEKRPIIILVHQFFGLRSRDTDLADELARGGYVAVCPDCFQTDTTSLIPRAITLVKGAAFDDDWEKPLRDVKRVLDYVLEQDLGDGSNIAICGFCFGGGVALRFANLFPEYGFKSVGVFYGKPISSIEGLKAPVYGVFGDKDRQFTPPMVNSLETLLRMNGIDTEFRRYPNQAHAFVDDIDCIRRGGDAGDAWNGWMSFLNITNPIHSAATL